MAALETTVSSPLGEITSVQGRVPAKVLVENTRVSLERQILRLQEHLQEIDNWTVHSHRGSLRVKTFEEMEERNDYSRDD